MDFSSWVHAAFGYVGLCFSSALCVPCLDLWFCFSLCERIFDFCLRNFALARATKGLCPLESRSLEKAGELFSFWCGSVGAVSLNIKSKRRTAKSASLFPPHHAKAKLSERLDSISSICYHQHIHRIFFTEYLHFFPIKIPSPRRIYYK